MGSIRIAVLLAGGFLWAGAAIAQPAPAGYPADYAKVIEAANREGKVVVYSSTDSTQARGLQNAFKAAYPSIAIDWNDLNTNVAYNRVISEAAAKQMGGDIVWSPAMDTQLNLVERGIAASYVSPEAANLPSWARYKDAAYATSVEPAVVVYNKALFPADGVPQRRADLIRVLRDKRDALKGKVTTFDPEKSGTGFMWATRDAEHTTDFWELAKAFGAAQGKVYASSGQMREKLVSGEHTLAYNMFGSYAQEWVRRTPNLVVAYQSDYTPAISRVVLVPREAPHPNAARVFLDFMLSAKGQEATAKAGLPSLRTDVASDNIDTVQKLANGNLKPTALNDKLLDLLDPKKRSDFLAEWKRALQP
jgi:iron(III) transport system substrate-binding protein